MIKAVIFDIDGVLLDSLETNFLFFQELLRVKGFSGTTLEEFKENLHFLPMWDVIKIITKLEDDSKVDEIWKFGRDKAGELRVEDSKLSEGAESLVKELSKDYVLAVVTSRVRPHIFEGELAGLKDYFSVAVGYEDTKNHKPHPEPLLFALEKLGVSPKEAVYVGDAATDVRAAKAAGVKIIGYSDRPLEGADANTSSLGSVLGLIKNLE